MPKAAAVAVKVQGLTRAPAIELHGPRGERYELNGFRPREERHVHVHRRPTTRTTAVELVAPSPGTWTATSSAPDLVSVTEAEAFPEPVATGHVSGHGIHRVFEYAVEGPPGIAFRFFERGEKYEQELGVAHGRPCLQHAKVEGATAAEAKIPHPTITCGSIPFTTARGPAGTRNIVAVHRERGRGDAPAARRQLPRRP